ncbi:MAG: exported protein of unknown function [Frankiales bacterium]|nr:exported protein of unknown function [Frankiales bacterium]
MFSVRRSRALRSRALVGVVVVGSLLGLTSVTSVASADVPAGQTVVGTVVRAFVEHAGEHDAGAQTDFGAPVTYIDPVVGASVRVPTRALAGVPVGATVKVRVGAEVADAPATTDHLAPAQQVLSASVVAPATPPTAPTTPAVTDSVSIAMVVPAGATQDTTSLSTVVGQVSGPVTQFWAQQSNGAIQVGVADTHDWGSVPVAEDCSDPTALWDDVAGRIGFVPGPGKHLMLYLPRNAPGCAYGLAEIGAGLHAGGYLYVTDTVTSVIAHELGHNFGLLHSGATECQGAVEGGTCQVDEYGDLYDVMGASWTEVGSLNAAQSARLGLLPAAQVMALSPSAPGGTYTVDALSGTTGTRAIRLNAANGRVYYLEYRPPSGQDVYLGDPNRNFLRLQPGVLLHRVETGSAADSAMLLDGTPSGGADYASDAQAALVPGVPVPVAGRDFTVTLQAASASAATVVVSTAADAYLRTVGSSVVRTAGDPSVYLVSGSTKYPVGDMATVMALSPLGAVTFVPQQYLDGRTLGQPMSRVVQGPDGTMYFLDAGIRLPFSSCAQVVDYGASCSSPVTLQQAQINAFYPGPPITPLYRTTSGKTFYVAAGAKREVADDSALVQAGLPTVGVTLLESGLGYLPYGVPVTRDGVVLRNRTTGAVTVSAGGAFTTVPEGIRAATALASLPVRSLDDAGLRQLTTSVLPAPLVKEAVGQTVYLLTGQGKRQVTTATMVSPSTPTVNAAFLGYIPDAGTLDAGTFLKGSANGTVAVLDGGLFRPVSTWSDLVALSGGNRAPAILSIDQRLADLLPTGPTQLGPGALVVSPHSATVYLVNGRTQLVPVASFATTAELGATRLVRVGDDVLAAYTVQTSAISTAIDCAGSQYLGLGGRLYPVGPDMIPVFGLSYLGLDPAVCSALPTATRGLARFLRAASGTIYYVDAGTKRPIGAFGTYLTLGGTGANTIQVSDFALSLIPTGAAAS